MKLDLILDFLSKNLSRIYIWLVLSIISLPIGCIYGEIYFSISASCFLVVILNSIVKFINYLIYRYHNSSKYKNMFKDFYSELKGDEKDLVRELANTGKAYRIMSDFPFEGSYGIRSASFYSVCSFPDEEDIKPIISTRCFESNSHGYLFELNSKYHRLWKKYLSRL